MTVPSLRELDLDKLFDMMARRVCRFGLPDEEA